MRFGNPVKQFAWTDCGIPAALGDLALIGRCVELSEIVDDVRRKRQGFENASVAYAVGISRWVPC